MKNSPILALILAGLAVCALLTFVFFSLASSSYPERKPVWEVHFNQAINALNRADVLFVPDKGASKADLADLRREIIARYVTNPASRTVTYGVPKRDAANPDYGAGVDDWHAALAGSAAE